MAKTHIYLLEITKDHFKILKQNHDVICYSWTIDNKYYDANINFIVAEAHEDSFSYFKKFQIAAILIIFDIIPVCEKYPNMSLCKVKLIFHIFHFYY